MNAFWQIAAITLAAAAPLAAERSQVRPKLDPDDVYKNNCLRCHASTPQYRAGATHTIVMHMRVRSNLIQEEADAVLEYLTGEAPVPPPQARSNPRPEKESLAGLLAAQDPIIQNPPVIQNVGSRRPSAAPPPPTPPPALPSAGATRELRTAGAERGSPGAGAATRLRDLRALMTEGRFPDAARGFAAQLSTASPGTLSVQVMIACVPDTIHHALANAGSAELYILPVNYKGRDCFRLCWGLYPTAAEATAAVAAVPAYFRQVGSTPQVARTAALLP